MFSHRVTLVPLDLLVSPVITVKTDPLVCPVLVVPLVLLV